MHDWRRSGKYDFFVGMAGSVKVLPVLGEEVVLEDRVGICVGHEAEVSAWEWFGARSIRMRGEERRTRETLNLIRKKEERPPERV